MLKNKIKIKEKKRITDKVLVSIFEVIMESNENLFISSELRTLQQKVQYEKDSENVLKNVDKGNSEKGLLEKLKDVIKKVQLNC